MWFHAVAGSTKYDNTSVGQRICNAPIPYNGFMMKNARLVAGRKQHACLLVAVALLFPIANSAQTSRSSTDARLAKLDAELDHARAEQRRWQKVIDTQKDLTQHPDKFSSLAEDAAHELKASGTDLVIDGVTAGISGSLNLQSDYLSPKAARKFKECASLVDALSEDLIKDHINSSDAEKRKPSEQNSRSIDKLGANLKLAAEAVTDPKLKEALTAATSMHVAALQFLNAYLVDDRSGMEKYLPATKTMFEGTRDVLKVMALHDPKRLQLYLKTVEREIPQFAPVATALSKAGIEQAGVVIALANIGVGGWGLARGFELSAEAEEIRDQQMEAAKHLQTLLPRARIELAHAAAEERRLTMMITALGGSTQFPKAVLPSDRFMDDAYGTPGAASTTFDVLAMLDSNQGLQHGITPEALSRLGEKFRRDSKADLDRREAEKRAQQELERRAREEARRVAEQQREWARDRDRTVEAENRGERVERTSSRSSSPTAETRVDSPREDNSWHPSATWKLHWDCAGAGNKPGCGNINWDNRKP
jgi:hypothetical protein